MGVITAANEAAHRAYKDIRSAADNLSKIFVQRCWGYEDYARNAELKMLWLQLLDFSINHSPDSVSHHFDEEE